MKAEWQRHVLACSGYIELGMFDEAAQVLEEIAPEEQTRNEVLGARVGCTHVHESVPFLMDGSGKAALDVKP